MYHSIADLVHIADTTGVPLWQIVLDNEMQLTGKPEAELWQVLEERYTVMEASAKRALQEPLHAFGGLIQGFAATQNSYAEKDTLCGSHMNQLMARALSCSETNAFMGKVCAAPTAGACGILPAVLITTAERLKLPRRTALEGLLTASGIGAVVMQNATVSGAEGGCQAECGVAAAMAAAAAVQMAGGSAQQSANAVSIALMNVMGLVCDPVAGLVQVPCAQRNASQAVNAMLSADMALAGIPGVIPADQMVEAMAKTGRMLPPALRETAKGGMAATPRAKKITKDLFHLKGDTANAKL